MSETCNFCGHAYLRATRTRYIHQEGDDILIVDDVPCIECEYCGEQYFAIDTLKNIEVDHRAVSAQRKQPKRTLTVAVEEYGAI